MFILFVVFQIIICVSLILVVLMQSSKGEGLAGGTAFGGGVSGAVFGGRGAGSFLSKVTTALAIMFMLNSGALALLSAGRGSSSSAPVGDGSSTVTQQAREDIERALQQQQAQQQLFDGLQQDTATQIQVQPGEAAGNDGSSSGDDKSDDNESGQ